MSEQRKRPRYPIYVPSKGRAQTCQTAKFLITDGVPFYLVVEPQEFDEYAATFAVAPECQILELPFENRGSVIPARNWIKEHATEAGFERHWQLDDNIVGVRRWHRGKRIPCDSAIALVVVEDFTDRYTNVAVSGMNYTMFGIAPNSPPFYRNVHVYSCSLILNSIPYEWRGRYNEDTDLCLQALAGGWCTILVNAFLAHKIRTMVSSGGNTDELYGGDGRLLMARSLERMWPGVVETKRRFSRPQHVVKHAWRRFDTPLKLKPGVAKTKKRSEYGIRLRQVAETVESPALQKMLEEMG